jgi:hypothetical protein
VVYQKRGGWFYRDRTGQLHKFKSEAEALAGAGITKGPDPFVQEEELEELEDEGDDMTDLGMFNG